MSTVKFRFINGSGSTDVNVPVGTTVDIFLQQNGIDPATNAVRVNSQPANPSHPLSNGDRVSVAPQQVKGNGPEDERDDEPQGSAAD